MSGHFGQFNLKMLKGKKVSFEDGLGPSLGIDGEDDKNLVEDPPTDETDKDKAQEEPYQILDGPPKKRQKTEIIMKKTAPSNTNALQQKRALEQCLAELKANGGVALQQLHQHGVRSVHLAAGF